MYPSSYDGHMDSVCCQNNVICNGKVCRKKMNASDIGPNTSVIKLTFDRKFVGSLFKH